MKKTFIISIFFPVLVCSQINLVPNSSFENTTSCPPYFSNLAGGGVLLDWNNPNTASPDYYNLCAFPDLSQFVLPNNFGFVGFATYVMHENGVPSVYFDGREYVSCELLESMYNTQYYLVQFYTRLVTSMSRCASNNLGVHFSDTAMHADDWYYFDVDAQVKYFNNEIIEDTAQWTLVRGLYQAHGGEQFLTFGNFNSDAETIQGMEYSDGQIWQTYFWIDEVSVIPLDSIPGGLPVDAGPDQTIYIQDSVFIGQKISNMPANWFKLDGTPVAQNTAGVYVSPLETTTYVVTQTLNGVYSTDTVTVFVIGLGLEEEKMPSLRVYPNPNNGEFDIYINQLDEELDQVSIRDLSGKEIYVAERIVEGNVLKISLNATSGLYYLELTHPISGNTKKQKIVILK